MADKRYPIQDIENQGADSSFSGFPMREMVGYDGSVLRRVKVDSSGNLVSATGNKFNTNAIDDTTTTSVTYICKESASGEWMITKINEAGSFPLFTYATITNNPTLTTYTLAYAARTTATYGDYGSAF